MKNTHDKTESNPKRKKVNILKTIRTVLANALLVGQERVLRCHKRASPRTVKTIFKWKILKNTEKIQRKIKQHREKKHTRKKKHSKNEDKQRCEEFKVYIEGKQIGQQQKKDTKETKMKKIQKEENGENRRKKNSY